MRRMKRKKRRRLKKEELMNRDWKTEDDGRKGTWQR